MTKTKKSIYLSSKDFAEVLNDLRKYAPSNCHTPIARLIWHINALSERLKRTELELDQLRTPELFEPLKPNIKPLSYKTPPNAPKASIKLERGERLYNLLISDKSQLERYLKWSSTNLEKIKGEANAWAKERNFREIP